MKRRRRRRHFLVLRPAHLAVAVALTGAFLSGLTGLAMLADYRPAGNVEPFELALRPPPPAVVRPVAVEPRTNTAGAPATAAGPYQSLEVTSTERAPPPARLIVESIGLDAPIIALGLVDSTGQMEVPEDVREVGWYRYGSAPGEVGSAVLAAHVDGYGQGRGAFFDLRELGPGDEIRIVDEDGVEQLFIVGGRATYGKDELPLDVIFSRSGGAILTLVTCGGGFNETDHSYDSNVVVYAIPAESASEYLADA